MGLQGVAPGGGGRDLAGGGEHSDKTCFLLPFPARSFHLLYTQHTHPTVIPSEGEKKDENPHHQPISDEPPFGDPRGPFRDTRDPFKATVANVDL